MKTNKTAARRGISFVGFLVGLAMAALILAIVFGVAGCDSPSQPSAQKQQAAATEQLTAEAQRQVGMPAIKNFQERKLMKQIIELRDREDLITYAYLVSLNGELVYLGKCVGFGLPYSVQFTSPESIVRNGHSTRSSYWTGPMPQPDPNGLYMPQGLSATWLMMLGDDGEVHPVYIEPQIIVSPFKLI